MGYLLLCPLCLSLLCIGKCSVGDPSCTPSPLPPCARCSPCCFTQEVKGVTCPKATHTTPCPAGKDGCAEPCPMGRSSWVGNRKNCHFLSCQHSREMISIFCGCFQQEKNSQPPAPMHERSEREGRGGWSWRRVRESSGGARLPPRALRPPSLGKHPSPPAPTDHTLCWSSC